MEISFKRTALRHRISRNRSRHVIEHAKLTMRIEAPASAVLPDERILFLGADQRGELIEVVAIESERGLVVIHAMPMRPRYRRLIE